MKIQYSALFFAAALALIAAFPHVTNAATKATSPQCCVEQQNCCESGQSCCN
ncbi:MAG: hypothetical protein P4L53_17875 [Candidatus Obscuribacterales bacterium]|nr:hypothetical protein [Candidatus Obscuribacterales bacterium]